MLWAGFFIGLVGSLHCVGMCGPIAMSLPGFGQSRPKIILTRFIYNLGRVVSYAVLGAVMGLIGRQISMAGYQQTLSIVLGILILVTTFAPTRLGNQFLEKTRLIVIFQKIQSGISLLFRFNSTRSMFLIGILNGLLPCGLVYLGLAGSLVTGSIAGGIAYMTFFGLGTFPMMLIISVLPHIAGINIRRKLNRFIPYAAIIVGILFILRGLSLGIPYVSPDLNHPMMHQTHMNVRSEH